MGGKSYTVARFGKRRRGSVSSTEVDFLPDERFSDVNLSFTAPSNRSRQKSASLPEAQRGPGTRRDLGDSFNSDNTEQVGEQPDTILSLT